jgi:hypothetical protein
LTSIAGLAFLLVFFVFPDGRFVPRPSRWLVLISAALALADPLFRVMGFTIPSEQFSQVFLVAILVGLALGVWAQIYRYRQISTAVQRQQSKWAVFGLAAMVIPIMLWSYFFEISPLEPGKTRALFSLLIIGVGIQFFIFMPVTFVVSIFRYRLWDIDLIIRRTLQYTLLTGLLALTFFGGVVILQGILRPLADSRDSPLVTVITTLGIAALFNPLRLRVQDFIDRRFYRTKYNAEQALAQFAATARDEVDMDKLTTALLGVVEETMQPEGVSLWLRQTGKRQPGPRGEGHK